MICLLVLYVLNFDILLKTPLLRSANVSIKGYQNKSGFIEIDIGFHGRKMVEYNTVLRAS